MTAANKKKFDEFLEVLKELENDEQVFPLYRGMKTDMAFDSFNLDEEHNTIDQFAERLFFFGDKAKSFWNNNVKRKRNKEIDLPYFYLNDLSENVFDYIFTKLHTVIKESREGKNKKRSNFISNNEKTSNFFQNEENRSSFLDAINSISEEEKEKLKKHYLVILHQAFNNSSHSSNSPYVSSSTDETKAKSYSKDGIVIYAWDCDTEQQLTPLNTSLPTFTGKAFESDKEISLFACIFPHYIHSFTYEKKRYLNPAVLDSTDFKKSILNGLEIDQSDFLERLKKETAYKNGVERKVDYNFDLKNEQFSSSYSYKELI